MVLAAAKMFFAMANILKVFNCSYNVSAAVLHVLTEGKLFGNNYVFVKYRPTHCKWKFFSPWLKAFKMQQKPFIHDNYFYKYLLKIYKLGLFYIYTMYVQCTKVYFFVQCIVCASAAQRRGPVFFCLTAVSVWYMCTRSCDIGTADRTLFDL